MRREAIGSLQKRSQQRGAAAVFAGIALVAMLAATTLVIDIGRLYLAQQQLQKQADIAALDSVRRVSSCSATEVPTQGELEAAASQSLARNGLEDIDAENLTVTAGRIISDEESSFRELIAEPMETASAVRVTVARDLPASLFPRGASAGSQRMRASATAMQPAAGSFYLGSTLASVDDGLLNAVIGGLICPTGDTACQNSVIALDVASASSGLLETSVTVAQLATALGVRVADLSDPVALSLMNPLLPDVLSDLSGALSATASGTVVALLDSLAGAAEGSAVPMGELFDDISADTPNAPLINLFDLLLALSQSAKADASGTTPIQLPINLSVPGIADIGVFLKVLEGPQFSGMGRPGQAMAETAQLTLGVRIAGGALLTGLSGVLDDILNDIIFGLIGVLTGITIDIDTLSPPLNIGIDVEAGKARAWLDRLDCPRQGINDGLPVAALSAEPSTAEVRVGSFTGGAFDGAPLDDSGSEKRIQLAQVEIDGSCPALLGLLCLPGVSAGSATIDIALDLTTISVGGAVNPIALNEIRDFQRVETDDAGNPIPDWHPPVWRAEGAPDAPPSPDNPQQVGAATNINIAMGVDVEKVDGSGLVGLLGDLLAALTTAVTNLIDGLLDVVNGLVATLIDPLLLALGVQTGTAEVTMDTVSIGHPRLVDTRVPEQQDN